MGRRPLGLITLAALALVALVPGADAAAPPAIVEVGWWTRATSQMPADGGFVVGVAPDGPTSVAAVRLDLGPTGVESARLQVQQGAASLQALAGIRVCYAVTPWAAAQGGPLNEAPAPDCSNQAVSLGRDDAGVWSADISPFTTGRTGQIAVMVVPDPNAGLAPGLPNAFDMSFEAPVLTATAAAVPVPPVVAPAETPQPADAPGSAGFFTPLTEELSTPAPAGQGEGGEIAPPLDAILPSDLSVPLTSDDAGPGLLRLGLWLRLLVTAALVGAVAGAARWGAFSLLAARR